MKTAFALCLASATAVMALLESSLPAQAAAVAKPAAARILLVTGIDYPGHLWKQTAPALKALLEKDPRLTVRVVEDPHFLDSSAITNYAVVILHWKNWEVPGPGPAARENLRRFVATGGGLMLTHFACGAWYGEWPEFKNLAGRAWFGQDGGRQHDPRGKFTVEIADIPEGKEFPQASPNRRGAPISSTSPVMEATPKHPRLPVQWRDLPAKVLDSPVEAANSPVQVPRMPIGLASPSAEVFDSPVEPARPPAVESDSEVLPPNLAVSQASPAA